MFVPFLALPLATHLIIFVADSVPKFDVTQSCRAAAAAANTPERLQGCLDSEQRAHDQLVKEWSNFKPDDRAKCVRTIKVFSPTYTELITCLEMARGVFTPAPPH